jgi:methyl-accepting chemotaxis protein
MRTLSHQLATAALALSLPLLAQAASLSGSISANKAALNQQSGNLQISLNQGPGNEIGAINFSVTSTPPYPYQIDYDEKLVKPGTRMQLYATLALEDGSKLRASLPVTAGKTYQKPLNLVLRPDDGDSTIKVVSTPASKKNTAAQGEFTDAFTGKDSLKTLDTRSFMASHLDWRTKLRAVIDGKYKPVPEIYQVAPDDQCAMGKWLYAPEQRALQGRPEYASLLQHHRDFHLTAGQILLEYRNNKPADAERLLETDLRSLSDFVQFDLIRLVNVMKQSEPN